MENCLDYSTITRARFAGSRGYGGVDSGASFSVSAFATILLHFRSGLAIVVRVPWLSSYHSGAEDGGLIFYAVPVLILLNRLMQNFSLSTSGVYKNLLPMGPELEFHTGAKQGVKVKLSVAIFHFPKNRIASRKYGHLAEGQLEWLSARVAVMGLICHLTFEGPLRQGCPEFDQKFRSLKFLPKMGVPKQPCRGYGFRRSGNPWTCTLPRQRFWSPS